MARPLGFLRLGDHAHFLGWCCWFSYRSFPGSRVAGQRPSPLLRYRYFPQFAELQSLQGDADHFRVPRYERPGSVHRHDDCDLAVGHVLLVSDALVRGQQHLEPCFLGPVQQGAVVQGVPSSLDGGLHHVSEEPVTQRPGGPFIEQDLHPALWSEGPVQRTPGRLSRPIRPRRRTIP